VHYYTYDEKSNDVKVNVMPSVFDPFCPIPETVMFNKLQDREKYLDKFIEKINSFSQIRSKIKGEGAVITAAIYGAYDLIKHVSQRGNSRIILFSANKTAPAILSPDEIDYFKYYSSENEIKLYLPLHNFISNLSGKFIEMRITFDLFVCGYQKNQIHIGTFFELANITGGNVYYYPISENSSQFSEDLGYKYEKLYYDINYLLTRKEYTDVQFVLRSSPELECEIMGPLKRNNNIITVSSVCSDFNICYNVKIKKTLKVDTGYHIQFVILYTDPVDGKRKKRCLNSTMFATDDYKDFYSSLDVDALTKIILLKELSLALNHNNKNICCFEGMSQNIKNRILNSLYFYKTKVEWF
jgi:hypothetical protein